jgi:hypothetical protein
VPRQFWQWLGASFVFAAVPFLLKGLVLFSYGEPTGFFTILGNGDLALPASILSSSALLTLYLIDKRDTADKTSFFIATLVVALFAIGYYGSVSKAFPNPRTADDVSVTFVSGFLYLCATIASWYSLRIAEEERTHDLN